MKPQEVIILMDAVYFGNKYCYIIFRAWFPKENKGKNLLWYKAKYETNDLYRKGIKELESKGREIIAIVVDGRQGLLGGFGQIPTQMCLQHMRQITTRYLTKKPKLEQNKQLKNIAACVGNYPEKDVKLALDVWQKDNKQRLNEKNENGNYVHARTRKAYNSIVKKLPYCYMFEKYSELGIPRTNNSLESINGHLKTKLSIHRGLREDRKDKFVAYYLWFS